MTARSPLAPHATWPDDVRRRYREAGYWTDETFAAFVADRTDRHAGRVALVGVDAHDRPHRWTYAELGRQAQDAAARLHEVGVAPGDRVVVALPNVVEQVAVVLGLFTMDALPVFAQPAHRAAELTQFCTITDAAALVVRDGEDGVDHHDLHERVSAGVRASGVEPPALVDVGSWPVEPAVPHRNVSAAEAEDVAFLQLSGGTTGTAKLIPRTHADYLYSVRASAEICALDAESVMLVALPAAHNFPLSSPGWLGVLHVGGRVVLARDPSPRTAFALVERERVTTVALVPPLAQAWIAAARRRPPDLSSLRTVQVGGARLNDVVAREVRPGLGARLQQVFGMAEGLVNYTRDDDPDDLVHGTQGRPISPDDEIRVVDADDRDVPDGVEGALLTRGPYTIRGYYAAGAAGDASFTSDGFYRTGDLVRRLPSGHLVVTGREKDQINRGGEKVAADEVEGAALTHPAVLDAVAVGVPDDALGERVWMVVRTAPGQDPPADLAAHVRAAGLAAYKVPERFCFVDAFPQTAVGKNSRRELRRALTDQLTTTP